MNRAIASFGLATLVAVFSAHACVTSSFEQTTTNESAGSSSSTASGSGFDKTALVENLAQQMVETYAAFTAKAETLAAATTTYASTLDPADHEAARQAWRDAMSTWQRAELMQVGPTGPMGSVLAGEDRRDAIYSWPLVNRCRVDQELVSGDYAETSTLAAELINVRGLDAIEYLLFYEGTANDCVASSSINTSGSWSAIAGQLAERRADYAKTAAILVADEAAALRERWDPSGGNFAGELAAPSMVYSDVQHSLNAISDAMFYLDTKTKDAKLAVPAGLSGCSKDVCPEALESTYAGHSKQAIVANLEGFQILLLGGPPSQPVALGFDDWLIALGQLELAADMAERVHAALAAAEAIEEDDLRDALADDPESVRALYFAVKEVTDRLKSEFVTVLDLNLPKTAEGDTD